MNAAKFASGLAGIALATYVGLYASFAPSPARVGNFNPAVHLDVTQVSAAP